MSREEFEAWLPPAVRGYVDGHVQIGSVPAETAEQWAGEEFAKLLPQGIDTPDHHLLTVEHDAGPRERPPGVHDVNPLFARLRAGDRSSSTST